MWYSGLFAAAEATERLILDQIEANVNIWQRIGAPDYPVQVLVDIQATAVITTLTTGNFVTGSTVRLTNSGYVLGAGGAGGYGGAPGGGGDPPIPGFNGQIGGNALELLVPTTLDMTTGYIWAGGGGGGGSDAGEGGGGGVSGGQGGLFIGGSGTPGGDATSGINAVPGTGSGDAGDGGTWGESGDAASPGGSGGNAGFAIERNGNSLIYLGDDEATLIAGGFIIGTVN